MSEIVAENVVIPYVKIKDIKSGKEYTLEFSRESVVFAQDRGFTVTDLERKPTRFVPDLFFYAMRMHHKTLARNQVDAIREGLFPNGVPMKVIQRLMELYDEACFSNVIALDEDDEIKNVNVEVEM